MCKLAEVCGMSGPRAAKRRESKRGSRIQEGENNCAGDAEIWQE